MPSSSHRWACRCQVIRLCLLAFLISPTAILPQGFTPRELQAGNYVDHFVVGSEVLLTAPLVLNEVQRVADKLGSAAGVKCQVRIINSSEINAFATAGGYIYINTGLLDFVESQDELAVVMAHELAHSLGNHYLLLLEREEKKTRRVEMFSDITSLVVDAAIRYRAVSAYRGAQSVSEVLKSMLEDLDTIYLQYLVGDCTEAAFVASLTAIEKARFRGYKKDLELEADLRGAKLAAAAGFNERALISLFKRMALIEEKQERAAAEVQWLLGNSPTLTVRIRALEAQ